VVSPAGKSSQTGKSLEQAESEEEDESSSGGVGRQPLAGSATAPGSASDNDGVLPTCFRLSEPDLEDSRSRDDLEARSLRGDAEPDSIISQRLPKNETACSRTWTHSTL